MVSVVNGRTALTVKLSLKSYSLAAGRIEPIGPPHPRLVDMRGHACANARADKLPS
jgi:hypothetical protein